MSQAAGEAAGKLAASEPVADLGKTMRHLFGGKKKKQRKQKKQASETTRASSRVH